MRDISTRTVDDLWLRIGLKLSDLQKTETHERALREWCGFLGIVPGDERGSKTFLTATDIHANAFHQWLKTRPGMNTRADEPARAAPATIGTKLSILRAIYSYLLQAGKVKMNPFYNVKIPPKDAKQKLPTELVPFAKVQEMIDYPDMRKFNGRLWRALLCTLFGSGIRQDEARMLRVSDFRLTEKGNYYLHLRHTKAQESQDQPIFKWAAEELQKFIRERRMQTRDPEAYIFVGRHARKAWKEPISPRQISRRFSLIGEEVGIEHRISPHSARKTYANFLKSQGYSTDEIQQLMRHKHTITTQRYLELSASVDEVLRGDLRY